MRTGIRPIFLLYSVTSSIENFPSKFGNSYNPASNPFAGRFRIAICLPSLKISTVLSSIFLAFAFFFTGISAVRFSACAIQYSFTGHCSHFGPPFGTHTIAPSSISPWLKSLAASVGITCSSALSIFLRTLCFMISS